MAIWKSYRIVEVIADIEDERFVLPVIQRRLVWDEEKMELLFDTLLKGDSFGVIMVIEEEKIANHYSITDHSQRMEASLAHDKSKGFRSFRAL
jgi:uncharacterized protein with ParB-like and HNH nuclease domain